MSPLSFSNAEMLLRPLIRIFWAVGACFCLPILAFSQQAPADTAKHDYILIDYFGKFVEDIQGQDHIKWISDTLQLRIDSTNIYADSAVIFNDNRINAYGNVIIQQGDSLEVFTDTMYYTKETDVADLIGEVVLRQGTKQLWTTDLSYNLGERFGEYHKGGVMVDKDLQMSSKQGIYFARDKSILFKDSVIVLHPKFNLVADSMRYLATEEQVQFTGPTNIYSKNAKTYCEAGYYDAKTETLVLRQNAQYADDKKTATAEEIQYMVNTGDVTMTGNVNVLDQDKVVHGNSLRYNEKTGETWIKGVPGEPATFLDSTRKGKGAEIFYNGKTNQMAIIGGGQIAEGSTILSYDNFNYDESTGNGKAEGNVRLRDTVSDFGVKAEILDKSGKEESYLFYSAPGSINRTLFYSIVDGDTLYIGADTLAMLNQVDTLTLDTSRIIKAYHDVRMFKSDMQGRTDSLVFHGQDSIFNFFGQPVLWTDTTQFSADSIAMALMNKKIHSITLTHKALIVSELLAVYYDQIKGKEIIAQFDSSKVKDMWVLGNAESIYYTQDDKDAFIGVNQTICSKMYFTFLHGQLQHLKYYGENTSSMVPMFEASHDQMRLEGFQWRPLERPHSVADVLK